MGGQYAAGTAPQQSRSAGTVTGSETEGAGPFGPGATTNSMYSPGGTTARCAGMRARTSLPALRPTIGSTTERWSASIRWVRSVRRTSTIELMVLASCVVIVNSSPGRSVLGSALVIDGRGPNTYGGL